MTRNRGRRARRRSPGRTIMVTAIGCAVAGTVAIASAKTAIRQAAPSPVAAAPVVTGNTRVDGLLARMSLTDKLRLIEWAPVQAPGQPASAVLPGLPRLGIPSLHLTGLPGGAAGIAGGAAGFTGGAPEGLPPGQISPLGVAATFSTQDAFANGMVTGRDARARGIQVVAGPFTSIGAAAAGPGGTGSGGAGSGWDGLAATFGEDPLLAGQAAAAEVAGIQGQGTMAMAVTGPGGGQAVGPAALHEFYLPPLEDAVQVGLAGVMCTPAASPSPGASQPGCGSTGTLSHLLRGELGFRGFLVAAPGGATTATSLGSGMDGEIRPASAPGQAHPTTSHVHPSPGQGRTAPGHARPAPGESRTTPAQVPTGVRQAIANGTLRLATVNRAVGVLLAQMSRFGLLGVPATRPASRVPAAADERVAQQTARDAATLLKNDRHALPLPGRKLGSLVVIGPGAGQEGFRPTPGPGDMPGVRSPAPGGGAGFPRQLSVYQALRARLAHVPGAHLTYMAGDSLAGTPVPATVLTHHGQPGLVRVTTASGAAAVVQSVNNTVVSGYPLPAGSGHSWTGDLTAPVSGTYTIGLHVIGAGASVAVDGTTVVRAGPGIPSANVTLAAGPHSLAVTEVPDSSASRVQIRLDWVTPEQQQAATEAARAVAANSAAAVVLAGGDTATGTLPDAQDRLIAQVAAANPDTIVVLNTPGPVAMPWLRGVAAVLEMWAPADASSAATADILLGRAGPAGRLPFTWPAPGQQPPAGQSLGGQSPENPPGGQPSGPKLSSQGQPPPGPAPGYRWFDEHRLAPLFPFGYGLSFTRFSYSRLGWSASPGNGLTLQFDITNTGRLPGQAVPQVYLGAPARATGRAQYAPRALATYTRVSLRPGQSETVTLRVPPRQLQYWDNAVGWVTQAGARPVYIGPDERTDALKATVTIPG